MKNFGTASQIAMVNSEAVVVDFDRMNMDFEELGSTTGNGRIMKKPIEINDLVRRIKEELDHMK
jgi:hypothetical protein